MHICVDSTIVCANSARTFADLFYAVMSLSLNTDTQQRSLVSF